jgi:hypothetical protein
MRAGFHKFGANNNKQQMESREDYWNVFALGMIANKREENI